MTKTTTVTDYTKKTWTGCVEYEVKNSLEGRTSTLLSRNPWRGRGHNTTSMIMAKERLRVRRVVYGVKKENRSPEEIVQADLWDAMPAMPAVADTMHDFLGAAVASEAPLCGAYSTAQGRQLRKQLRDLLS